MTTTATVEARMANPAALLPGVGEAIGGLISATRSAGLPEPLLALVHLRVSLINGCASCLHGGTQSARAAGETDERLATVGAWREAPWYSEQERVALELAEQVTRLADAADAVPDALWDAVVREFDEPARAALLLWIAVVNLFNRCNAPIRQVAGTGW
ncbi:carboxymuconolactone decarboxylase family protein [Actinomycetospora termitidis]|uniref:Carboxymuconolactone decarboxylase family protein n=1 Tax=Actinomycetospora termitidis TaxID=3053470 RepID=A0ABT7MCI2_9PSEU|nr:carboxymuconolactone decarboxylase family protein [Actinomycetospora sp. Odt1-22]MDL5157532.1 carboxymuconolactone decarboxylase family protein [Actinomycetospora sp. Odt1-22]